MKELLLEFLGTILKEVGREFKAVKKGKDGKERVVPFGSKESMQKAIATPSTDGTTYRPYNPATDGKLEKEPSDQPSALLQEPPTKGYGRDFIGKQGRGITPPVQTTLQTPQSTEKVADAVRTRIKTGLDKIASVLTDLRKRGIAGAGGAAASQGESLFTQFGNALSEKDGIVGVLELARETAGFGDVTTKYSGNEVIKGDALVGDKRKLTSLKNIRRTIAKDFGWDQYDDDDEENRRVIAEYLALRETYVNNRVEEAKLACTEGTDHVFCKKGKAGFGESEEAYVAWLDAAFDGSVRLDSLIRSGDTRIDPERGWTTLQSDNSKEAQVGGYSPDKLVLDELTALRATATSDEDKAHYDYQIGLFKKLGFHDTFIVGYDKQGRLAVLHDSNKKSSDLDDPHNNTTPETRLVTLQERYKNDPELLDASEAMVKVIDDQLEVVRDIKTATVRASSRLPISDSMVTLAESSHMKKYMDNMEVLATSTRKGSFGHWLSKENDPVLNWQDMDTKQKLQAMQKFMMINPQDSYSSFGYVFTKMGELAGKKNVMRDVFGKDGVEGLEGVQAIKSTESDAVNATYQTVVKELATSDTRDGHTPPPENGRHVQMYVDSVLDALHFNTYIDNYDQDMVMSIGRHAVTPAEIRETFMEILPKEFTKTIDINTPEGRQALKTYLRENSRIDAKSGAIVMSTPDGECSIGEDSWRTAGKTPKVATSFGSCFRDKLRKKTSEKPVLFLGI